MRPVATIDDERLARRFGDYLLAQGVRSEVDRGSDGWIVWVIDEDDVARAADEYEHFKFNPEDERYTTVSSIARARRREQERAERERDRNIVTLREGWFAQTRGLASGLRRRATKTRGLTLVLIVLSVTAAIATGLGDHDNPFTNALLIASVEYTPDGNITWDGLSDVRSGEAWRLITPIFLHFTFLHILFNMWWLRDLGMAIQRAKGNLMLLGLVVVSGVTGNLGQYFATGPLGGGMSGVVYALFGYIWMQHRFNPGSGLVMPRNTVYWLMGWLLICFTGWVGPIGNVAHVGGLVVGMAWGALPALWRRMHR
jgi:GlpG protein